MSAPLRIAVLRGGDTSEREISLKTGQAVIDALRSAGHAVADVVLGDPLGVVGAEPVRSAEVVFVALHGGAGEDGRVQALLEFAGKPYVGSRPGPSAVAMDKVWTKRIASSIGVPTAPWVEIGPGFDARRARELAEDLGPQRVVKPTDDGSAVGVHLCLEPGDFERTLAELDGRPGRWMVERYVAGRELTVPLLWSEAYPVIEIRPREGFYDYSNKYTAGRTEYDCPADLDPAIGAEVSLHARRLHEALHLRDMARIDFRLHPREGLFLLEANTIPGMTATSLLPMGARARGIDFVAMCDRLCRVAHERGPQRS